MSLPYEIEDVPTEVNEELMSVFSSERDGYVYAGPNKYLLGSPFRKQAHGFYNLELRPDDVWVVTFPRTGTTLTQELVWLVNNDLDYETAQREKLNDRFPFIDLSILACESYKNDFVKHNNLDLKTEKSFRKTYDPGYEMMPKMKSPRHIKSHLPLSLLPPKLLDTCKVIYVARNPKDVAVSYYYISRHFTSIGFQADFNKFWELFQRNLTLWAPYWCHVEEAWKERHHPNMLFLFYEDMKKDMKATVHKVADFLKKTLTDEDVSKILDHLNFENFSKNPAFEQPPYNIKGAVNEEGPGFFRQGKSGSWKTDFSPELNEKADEWIKENENLTGIRFQS